MGLQHHSMYVHAHVLSRLKIFSLAIRTGASGTEEVNHGSTGALTAAANVKSQAFPVLQRNQDVYSN